MKRLRGNSETQGSKSPGLAGPRYWGWPRRRGQWGQMGKGLFHQQRTLWEPVEDTGTGKRGERRGLAYILGHLLWQLCARYMRQGCGWAPVDLMTSSRTDRNPAPPEKGTRTCFWRRVLSFSFNAKLLLLLDFPSSCCVWASAHLQFSPSAKKPWLRLSGVRKDRG